MSTRRPTLWARLRARLLFVRALGYGFLQVFLGRGDKTKPAGQRILYGTIRYLLDWATVEDDYTLGWPGTEGKYLDFAKKKGFQPDTVILDHGAKAHWIGPRDAERVIVYFHGGGYAVSASPGHYYWLGRWTDSLSKKKSTSAVVLNYSLTPEAPYPVQLRQAVSLMNWLLTEGGKTPEQLVIGGDSAGGNLTLAILSHILHPHPKITQKLKLSGPLGGALLISPWVNFTKHDPIFVANLDKDIIGQQVATRWGPGFRGASVEQDNYVEAVFAEPEWFQGLERIVSNVWVWAGGSEVLLGSINDMTVQLKRVHSAVDYLVEDHAIHTEMYIDASFAKPKDTVSTRQIEKWLSLV